MRLVDDILNAKYFAIGSRDQLKATILSLLLLLAILIMAIDVYDSITLGFVSMSIIEGGSAVLFVIIYLLFPRVLSLSITIIMVLSIISFLFLISLTVDGANSNFALFWLATLPIYYFFFLGLRGGVIWSIGAVFALLLTSLNAHFALYPPLYISSFLLQVTIAYITISYLLYVLERERYGYECSLESSIKDREILLKEVHHRTKNNMQIMISLLDTQSFKIDDPKYKAIFQSHINRISSMAKIHEHLYGGKSFERIEVDRYLYELTNNLNSLASHNIIAHFDPLTLDMGRAINISLVFNELLTNAIEHAYSESGTIEVSLRLVDSTYLLEIRDYGKGFDATIDYDSLGLTLVRDLARTLSSQPIVFDSDEGTCIRLYCDKLEER